MRRMQWVGLTAGMLALLVGVVQRASCQEYEIQQLLLDLQKLSQEKQILSDLYKGYAILSKGYAAIRDISKGSFDLHKSFLDGLLAVSPVVRSYKRVTDIINLEGQLLERYQYYWGRFRKDPHFGPDELLLIMNVYTGLFDQSTKNLSTLTMLLTDGEVRASDAERMEQIDGLYRDLQAKKQVLDSFNNQTALLSLNRAADQQDVDQVKLWYGLNF